MEQWISQMMTSLGYWGIGLLMFLENLFPPIPSELIMPLAGFTVAQGKLDFIPAVLAGIVGTVLGALPWYYLGYLVNIERIEHWVDRYGKWLGISVAELEKSRRWFNRHGRQVVFWGRLVPGIRTLISLPAGIEEMPLGEFLFYSTLGTTVWTLLLTCAGYFLGQNYTLVENWLAPVSKFVIVALGLAALFWLGQRIWKARSLK
jgi:membrane protein DedA with SNARE-associated domain